MARTFGEYSPVVPLGTTWEEQIYLDDEDGQPLDLTGYEARAQLRTSVLDVGAPALELSSLGVAPTLFVQRAGVVGLVEVAVQVPAVNALSPDWTKRKFVWDIELYIPGSGGAPDYVIPCVTGKVTVTRRATKAGVP
jgi:hypothetical protein